MPVRGKFTVVSRKAFSWSPQAVEIELQPVYDSSLPEDQKYSQATPSGHITILVDNPPASNQLQLGKTFYIDFTAVE